MTTETSRQAEFSALSGALKRCRGAEFEEHGHPAVLLDRVTGPAVRVWGWWVSATQDSPCLLWRSERGWCATVVEPDEGDAPGYDRAFWSHRIRLLDLALANALGPCPSLGVLELLIASDPGLALGPSGPAVKEALLWGIVQLRAARWQAGHSNVVALANAAPAPSPTGRVDAELARHALMPTLAKRSTNRKTSKQKDPAVEALLGALREARPTGNLTSHQ